MFQQVSRTSKVIKESCGGRGGGDAVGSVKESEFVMNEVEKSFVLKVAELLVEEGGFGGGD